MPRRSRSVSGGSRERRSRERRRRSRSFERRRRDRGRRRSRESHERRRSRRPSSRSRSPLSHDQTPEKKDVTQPNLALSGKLAAETNTVNGVVLKYTEPAEAKLPETRWRLYIFKANEMTDEPLPLHRQTAFLFGRDRTVCDVPTDHPSCSKQHCVIQHRYVGVEDPVEGTVQEVVKPYLMDLGSVNGTFINKQRIEPQRYYELLEQDTIRLGLSSREYVLLHEKSG